MATSWARTSWAWAWATRWALVVLVLATGASATRANEQVFAALAQRGLEPWPEAFLTEIPFTVGLEGEGLFEAEGYQIRLPRPTQAGLVLAALPGKMVIVDVAAGTGPVALSREALAALGVGQGAAPQTLQILALRPIGGAVAAVAATGATGATQTATEASQGPPTAQAPRTAPVPPLRPGAGVSVATAAPSTPAPPVPVSSDGEDVARIEFGQDATPLVGAGAARSAPEQDSASKDRGATKVLGWNLPPHSSTSLNQRNSGRSTNETAALWTGRVRKTRHAGWRRHDP